MSARIVLDSSAVIAATQPAEAAHADASAFLERLRAALAAGLASAFAPPELWLEVYVAEQRLARGPRWGLARQAGLCPDTPGREPAAPSALAGLAVTQVAPPDLASIEDFLDRLTARTRGRRPFVNATDLVYLWAAYHVDAVALVTLDRGLLKYDRMFCEVRRPQDVWFG